MTVMTVGTGPLCAWGGQGRVSKQRELCRLSPEGCVELAWTDRWRVSQAEGPEHAKAGRQVHGGRDAVAGGGWTPEPWEPCQV